MKQLLGQKTFKESAVGGRGRHWASGRGMRSKRKDSLWFPFRTFYDFWLPAVQPAPLREAAGRLLDSERRKKGEMTRKSSEAHAS